jgi:hypothetical protein
MMNSRGYTLFSAGGVYALRRTERPQIGVFRSEWGRGVDDFRDRKKVVRAAKRWCRNAGYKCKLTVDC